MDSLFANPEALLLLALVPLLAIPMARRGGLPAVTIGSTAVASGLGTAGRHRFGVWIPSLLRVLSAVSLIVALARPQFGTTTAEVEASGVDIMLAVDVSSSMLAEGLEAPGVNRLDAVKSVLEDFVEKRPNDRLGLVAFAGDPWLVSPLTLDHDWLIQNLERVKIGMVEDGTAIGSAVATGTARLQDTDAESRVLVLLTDGANNAGSVQPALAAEAARALGVKVYTVGVGSEDPRPVRITDAQGTPRIVELGVESDTLRTIADETGGRYFLASDASALASIYDEIDLLETTTRTVHEMRHVHEVFGYPAGFGLLFLVGEFFFTVFGRLRLP